MKCPYNPRHSVLATMGNTPDGSVMISYFCVKYGLIGVEGWQEPLDKH